MGNSLHIPVLGYNGSQRLPCRLQLPSAAMDLSIHVTKEEDGALVEDFDVLYTVDESTCKLKLTRNVDKANNIKSLDFLLSDKVYLDCGSIHLSIESPKASGLATGGSVTLMYNCLTSATFESSVTSKKTNKAVNAWGSFTTTSVYFYGWSGNRRGLVVVEWKKNMDQQFTEVTMAHYLASYRSKETDIGFSVVAKVQAFNDGKSYVTVEGPVQHPASALFYMFDEVNRTESWKPTMCPHCDQNRRHHRRMAWQSENEDSDSDLLPSFRANRQNARRIDNSGRFGGHANGSSIRCRNFYGF